MPLNPRVASAYGDWLDELGDWHYWGTLTFAEEHSPRSIRRCVESHLKRLDVDRAFWGIETGALFGRKHAHALYSFRDFDQAGFYVPPARLVWRDWFDRFGRAHVDAFEPERGAAHYVTKYVAKELADYDLYVRPARAPPARWGHDSR